MTRRAVVRKRAEADITKAYAWYEKQHPGLGPEFVAEVRATVRAVAERPESFPIDYQNARRALTHRFPYKVYFVVEPARVVVVAVLHNRQSKARLRGRL